MRNWRKLFNSFFVVALVIPLQFKTSRDSNETVECLTDCTIHLLPKDNRDVRILRQYIRYNPLENGNPFDWFYDMYRYFCSVNNIRPESKGEIKNSIGRIDKDVWGRNYWFLIHYVSVNMKTCDQPDKFKTYKAFIACILRLIPCKICYKHFREYLERNNLIYENLFLWSYLLHNKINSEEGKPLLPYHSAYNLYSIL